MRFNLIFGLRAYCANSWPGYLAHLVTKNILVYEKNVKNLWFINFEMYYQLFLPGNRINH